MDMKITGVYNAFSAYQVKNSQGNPRKVEHNGHVPHKDTFTLSMQAEDFQAVRKAPTLIPETREGLVNHIRDKVAEGTYDINANAIAAKIFQGLE